jgi:O-antigen/teichoic acid export membrane protein
MSTRRQYLLNIIWSWIGALAMILSGLVVAPYIIRKLGADRYGVWALTLSFVEYFWLIDVGVRPAVVKLGAEYRALDNREALNRLINTGVVYSAAIGLIIVMIVGFNTANIARFFRITEPSFPLLIQVVSVSWALGMIANVFSAGLEAFHRFDTINHIFVSFVVVRSCLFLLLVASGFELTAMAIALFATQLLMYTGFIVAFFRVYPELRLSPALATRAQALEMWQYARQIVSAVISGRLLQSLLPSMIARFLEVRYVTYFTVTQRILDYAGEGISRIGLVITPRASDWMARGYRDNLVSLARYGNRYALCLWLLFGTFILTYSEPLFRLWINADFAREASGLVPPLVFGYTLWMGQFISASILMGIARYSTYSHSLLIEAVLTIVAFALVLPVGGLVASAVVVGTFIALNRCLNLSLIFCREFSLSPLPFLRSIYAVPLALAAADLALLWMVRRYWLPGNSWFELTLVGCLNTVCFTAVCLWTVAEPDHRQFLFDTVAQRWRALRAPQIQPRNL